MTEIIAFVCTHAKKPKQWVAFLTEALSLRKIEIEKRTGQGIILLRPFVFA